MFPSGMFAKSYFTGTYFPPVEGDVTPPIIPPMPGFGRPRPQRIPPGWPIDLDDEELMFWIL